MTDTDGNIKNKNTLKKRKKEEEEKLIKECLILKTEIEKIMLVFKVKTGATDRVFGTISSKQIISELKKQKINIEKTVISKDTNINCLGVHIVKLNLHKTVIADLKVQLIKEG